MRSKVARSRDSLTRVAASVALNVSRSVRPTSALAASASSASEGEMRSSARRRSPMNSNILSSILFAVGAAAQGSAARRSGDRRPETRLGARGLTRLGGRRHGARTLSSALLTRSRSFSYFTSIVRVDSTSAGSSACALRMTSERAQSSDSETDGGLRSSSARIFCTAATTAAASFAGISGTLSRMISSSSAGAGKSMKRCRHRRLSPSDSSRALFDVSTTSGMCLALTVPSSGTERSEEHTSELQSPCNLVCRLLLEKKKKKYSKTCSLKKHKYKQRQHD